MVGRLSLFVLMALSFGQPGPGGAVETEARAIDAMLIAPCCFTQQVSLHQSPAADEVRRDVRARLAAGQTRQQTLDAYVARYGTRILVEPPARGVAVTLYVVPHDSDDSRWSSFVPPRLGGCGTAHVGTPIRGSSQVCSTHQTARTATSVSALSMS